MCGWVRRGKELDLTSEPLGSQDVGQVGMKSLEGNGPVVLEVSGQEYRSHAAAPEFALNGIGAREVGFQQSSEVWHGGPGSGKGVSDSWRIHGGVVGSEIRPRIRKPSRPNPSLGGRTSTRNDAADWSVVDQFPHAGVVPTTPAPPARGRRRERSGGRRGRPRRSRRIPSRNGRGSRRWRGPRGGAPSLS